VLNATPALTDNAPIQGDRKAINLTSGQFLQHHFPRRALRKGIEGSSVVLVRIDASGKVAAAELISSQPEGVFDRAAIRAALQMRYQPAIINGEAAASSQRTTLDWSLE
jgi:TonB family protein